MGAVQITPEQKEQLSRIVSRFLNLQKGTPVAPLRKRLGSERKHLDELLRADFLITVAGEMYLPTLNGIDQLEDDIRNRVHSTLTSVLIGIRELYRNDDRTTFGVNVILEETKRQDPTLDQNDLLPALILGSEFGLYGFPNGIQWGVHSRSGFALEEDRFFVEEVTVNESILDFTTLKEQQKQLVAARQATREFALEAGRAIGDGTETIFIGHGHSLVWRQLRDFLTDRLQLACDEFNSEAVAGITTTARLQQVLEKASFAFLVLTAEDTHSDSTVHARENVIHEVGLFQGKIGFDRAIILLEAGCELFSNIHGLSYIEFPKDDLEPAFERIRRVLEREHIL